MKFCDMIRFWRWLISGSVWDKLPFLPYCSGSFRVLVTTKSGVCCNKSRNITYMENCFGLAIFPAKYFSSPVRLIWVWPKYDVINRLSLSIFKVLGSQCTANMIYVVWKYQYSSHALMHLRIRLNGLRSMHRSYSSVRQLCSQMLYTKLMVIWLRNFRCILKMNAQDAWWGKWYWRD